MKGEEPMKGEELWGLTQASESESRGKYPEDEGSCHEAEEEQGKLLGLLVHHYEVED